MRLRNVTFANWLRLSDHRQKEPKERWRRELYPWPVLAQVDCDTAQLNRRQRIVYDEVEFEVTLKRAWLQERGTYRYRLLVESTGLGWHSRSYADVFDMCATADGDFVTLFHTKSKEPLEKIAERFFGRRWRHLNPADFKTLAVSRFLAASIAGEIAEDVFKNFTLTYRPETGLLGPGPMLVSGDDLWVGYRFFSEHAYAWARSSAERAKRVVALYFADSDHQFKTELPSGATVQSISYLDSTKLGGKYGDLIRVLLRGLELPVEAPAPERLASIVLGRVPPPNTPLVEADVHEALAALKRPCASKSELRYQLAAAVVLNAWVESERHLGFSRRKKFYAFKQQVNSLAKWAIETKPSGVSLWAEVLPPIKTPILYIRIDEVDFSFHQIPVAYLLVDSDCPQFTWSQVRLKPIAPLVLAWARGLLDPSVPTPT